MKEEILDKIKIAKNRESQGRNSMGCSENNYDPYFAVGNCFSEDELNLMSKKQLDSLIKLGNYLSEAFY